MRRWLAVTVIALLTGFFAFRPTLRPEPAFTPVPAKAPTASAPERAPKAPIGEREREELHLSAREIFESGDVCTFRHLGKSHAPEHAAVIEGELIRLLLAMPSTGDADTAGLARLLADKSILWSKIEPEGERQLFNQALALSGQLFSSERAEEDRDFQRAMRVLDSLRATDPGNGAFQYFRIGLMLKAGTPPHQLKQEFLALFDSPRFETFQSDHLKSIHEQGLTSPLAYILSTYARAYIPSPEFFEVTQALRAMIPVEDEQFARAAMAFGKMVRDTQRARAGGMEWVEWSALEFQVGGVVAKVAWSRLHPEELPPREFTESYADQPENQDLPIAWWRDQWSKLANARADNCGARQLEAHLPAMREAFRARMLAGNSVPQRQDPDDSDEIIRDSVGLSAAAAAQL